MKNNYTIYLLLLLIATPFFTSCNKDEDLRSPEERTLQNIKEIDNLLQYNFWNFNDLIIDVTTEMRAIPLLANIADENGMVQPGQYDAIDIYGNSYRQENFKYQFLDKSIYLDSTSQGNFTQFANYQVLRSDEISINQDSSLVVRYNYEYLEDDGIFTMTSSKLGNEKINKIANIAITKSITSGKPDDIANKVVDNILNNEEIGMAIQQLLYDVIHSKVDEITQNPEEVAQKLAELVLEKLKEVDWEMLVYDKLVEILEQLKVDNPEAAAQELATKISDKIETGISKDDIYAAILPILQNFEDETLPKLIPNISDAIYGLILDTFSEENVYNKIYPLWASFSEVDSASVISTADTLGSIVTDHFFDVSALATKLEPFIQTLRTTSTVKIPALAQDIIDDVLIPVVDSLNANFPALELDPDWASIKPILSSALTLIKSSIGDQTNIEAATSLAESIISIMDGLISKAFEVAIYKLQDIPAEQAAQVIATWVNNLVVMAEPDIVAFLEEKLNELVALFNAEEIAQELATAISNKLLDIFSYDNIYELLLPIMEALANIDVEASAEIIASWLSELNILDDSISEEQVLEILSTIITELIGKINVDNVTEKLVQAIMGSDAVSNIDGAVLSLLIEFKTYQLLIDIGHDLDAIDKVQLSISKQ